MYAASKVSSSMIVRILAAEVGSRDITSNSLIVGPVAAGFLSGDGAFDAAGGILDQLAKASPAGRLGTLTTSRPSRRFSHDPRRAGPTASC
jgi:3-oxoacyl-[acyl-carrier protein] reductase